MNLVIIGLFLIGFFIPIELSYAQVLGDVNQTYPNLPAHPDQFVQKALLDETELLLQDYVTKKLILNENILKESIKSDVMGSAHDVNHIFYSGRILYDEIKDQKIRHMDLIFDVDFANPQAKLVNKLEMQYIPPKKVVKIDLIGENGDPTNWPNYIIICRYGFDPIMKNSDRSIACVKSESVQKLLEREWAIENTQIKNTKGLSNFSLSDSKKGDFQILYSLQGSDLVDMESYSDANSLLINLENSLEGKLIIHLPRDLVDAIITENIDDDFFILVDGEEVDFDETAQETKRILDIKFPKDATQIEIIGTIAI